MTIDLKMQYQMERPIEPLRCLPDNQTIVLPLLVVAEVQLSWKLLQTQIVHYLC